MAMTVRQRGERAAVYGSHWSHAQKLRVFAGIRRFPPLKNGADGVMLVAPPPSPAGYPATSAMG